MGYGVGMGGFMSKYHGTATIRMKLCKAVCVLLLAASAAACDQCGNFAPIRFQADQQVDACRDAPRPR
jgi:hypothetical protein